jgi:hypothetical protein
LAIVVDDPVPRCARPCAAAAARPGEADVIIIIIGRPEPESANNNLLRRKGAGAAGDLTIVRPAAAAPPRRPEQVEQHRAAQPRARETTMKVVNGARARNGEKRTNEPPFQMQIQCARDR